MKTIYYKFTGDYWPIFWGMILCNFVIPVIILSNKKLKTIPGILIASFSVIIGMWLERLNIVVPSLANPRLHVPHQIYIPSLVEWALFLAGLSAFALAFLLFSKFFPLISVWEIKDGRKEGIDEVRERITSYQPDITPGLKGQVN